MRISCLSPVLCLLLLGQAAVTDPAHSFGQASYYNDKFDGRPTASGELYDKEELTAAHRTYPFGTRLLVTRLDTKQSVEVRVNDRGPHSSGRVIDLSRKAAEQLDLVRAGLAEVEIKILEPSELSEDFDPALPLARPTPISLNAL